MSWRPGNSSVGSKPKTETSWRERVSRVDCHLNGSRQFTEEPPCATIRKEIGGLVTHESLANEADLFGSVRFDLAGMQGESTKTRRSSLNPSAKST